MFRRVVTVLLVAAAIAMAARFVMENRTPDEPAVSDLDFGLRRTALTDDRVPPRAVFTDATPGGNQRIARAYDGAPPLVPHSLDGFVPITASDNSCLLCHQTGSTDAADPPQVSRSHLIDFRTAPNVVRETVAGARWNCMACHVMQSDAPLLVENHFKSGGR